VQQSYNGTRQKFKGTSTPWGIKNFHRKFKGISTLGALICAPKKFFFPLILNSTSKPWPQKKNSQLKFLF